MSAEMPGQNPVKQDWSHQSPLAGCSRHIVLDMADLSARYRTAMRRMRDEFDVEEPLV